MKVSFRLVFPNKKESTLLVSVSIGIKKQGGGSNPYKPFRKTISVTVPTQYWDKNRKRVKEIKAVPNARQINLLLNKIETDLEEYEAFCFLEKKEIKQKDIEKIIAQSLGSQTAPLENSLQLVDIARRCIEDSESGKRLQENGQQLKKSVYTAYKYTLRHIEKFEEEYGTITTDQFDEDFFTNWADFQNQQNHSINIKAKTDRH